MKNYKPKPQNYLFPEAVSKWLKENQVKKLPPGDATLIKDNIAQLRFKTSKL